MSENTSPSSAPVSDVYAQAPISFRVNGEIHVLREDPQMPLLWAVRDVLGLTGTKYGCGEAQCGACTVHVDGHAVRSCVTPIAAMEGRSVVTIEGLSPDGMHPVQKAWLQLNVAQCGYCQTGQIMCAVALLSKVPHPTVDQINTSLAGNICRCGAYGRIREAVLLAAYPVMAQGTTATPLTSAPASLGSVPLPQAREAETTQNTERVGKAQVNP